MPIKHAGWCRGCNRYFEDLKLYLVKNNNTGNYEIALFCKECEERFHLNPFYKTNIG